jgi:hypothetical protein
MASTGRKKSRFILIGIIALPVLAALVLGVWFVFFRPPVLLVSDAFFDGIYGPWRIRLRQAEVSLRLFRPVRVVTLGENAEPELAALAVEEAGDRPYGVLFPFRYVEGARRYVQLHPEIPVAVLGGRLPREEGVLYFKTDTAGDLYRAGRAAALLVQSGGGGVYVFQDPRLSPEERRSFREGLQGGGYQEEPEYVYGGSNLREITGVSVLMSGAPPRFFEEAVKTPVILFSWIDPALTSREVKVVFDDSPWALVIQAVEAMSGGGTALSGEPAALPARVLVLGRRIPDRMLAGELKKALYNGTEDSVNDSIDTLAGVTMDFFDKAVDFITGKAEWIERGIKTLFRGLTKNP